MIDVDDPLAPRGAYHVAQQHLVILNRATPEVVAVEMQEIEREIGEPLWPPLGYGVAQRVEVCDAAIVRNGDLAVENHWRQAGIDQIPKRLAEYPGSVVPIAAEQQQLAVTRKDGD